MTRPDASRSHQAGRQAIRACVTVCSALLLGACAAPHPPEGAHAAAQLTPATASTRDLFNLPEAKAKVVAAVYGFRDQTGQYKPAPDSSFSTSVTQGAASMLIKALKDSRWFIPVEREGLQELLTERRILRAINEPVGKTVTPVNRGPSLMPAAILIEGGVIAYDSNVRTGGIGAQFLGIGLSTQYRIDQVTVNLRSVDIDSGEVLQSVSTTKTIYSYEIHPSVFKFVAYKELLEIEAGITHNEPAQLCVKEAIEAAVLHLAVQGLKDRTWALKNPKNWYSPIIQKYLSEENNYAALDATKPGASATTNVATTAVK